MMSSVQKSVMLKMKLSLNHQVTQKFIVNSIGGMNKGDVGYIFSLARFPALDIKPITKAKNESVLKYPIPIETHIKPQYAHITHYTYRLYGYGGPHTE